MNELKDLNDSNENENEPENEKDLTGAIAGFVSDKKDYFIVAAAVIILVTLIILGVSVAKKNSGPHFTNTVAENFDSGKYFTMKRDKLLVTMRISDIRSTDPETGNTYTSTFYASDNDIKKVYADFFIENKTGRLFNISSSNSGGIYLGYDFDADGDLNSDSDSYNYMSFCKFCENGAEKDTYSINIKSGQTQELRFVAEFPASYVNMINALYFCEALNEKNGDTEYTVAGIGEPFMNFRFKNETFFPQMVVGTETAPPVVNETATSQTVPVSSRFPVQRIPASSPVLADINSKAKGMYELSIEIRADGDASTAMTVQESSYAGAMSNGSYVGVIPEILYEEGLEVDSVTVYFTIAPSLKNNVVGAYTGVSDDFVGIKRLNVIMYDEETNMAVPLETFHDEDKNLVYAKLDRVGSVALADMEKWYNMLGITPDEIKK